MDEGQGYFDLQVNGYGGVDFNADDLSADGLHAACERLRADGVAGALVTFTTERLDRMVARIGRLVGLRERDPLARQVIAGLHIEGPFISGVEGYRGAHPADAVRPASVDELARLVDAGAGLVRLVTLAPECDPGCRMVRWLADRGIRVAAGHTDASLDQLRAAADAGLSVFTHLGNGCANLIPRHDNIIMRALSLRDRLWLCFIADGVHVPFVALGNYLALAGSARAVVVTDAVTPAGLGPGEYLHGQTRIVVRGDGVARVAGTEQLIGSTTTMRQAKANLVRHLSLTEAEALRLTVENPRRAVGL